MNRQALAVACLVAMLCAVTVVLFIMTDRLAWIVTLPFYLLNAWNFWLGLLELGLLIGILVYVRRKLRVLQVVSSGDFEVLVYSLLSVQLAPEQVKPQQPKQTMNVREFPHV
jgi:hypothetical protein